jgi:hypothetical protein
MKRLAQILSVVALIGTLIPPCLFFADKLGLPAMQQWLFGATVLWFIVTPLWMEHKTGE